MTAKSIVIPINCGNSDIPILISEMRRVSTYLNSVRPDSDFKLAIEAGGFYKCGMYALGGLAGLYL
jgi:hypothetical protein